MHEVQNMCLSDDQKGRTLAQKWFRTEEAAWRFNNAQDDKYADNPHISIDILMGDSGQGDQRSSLIRLATQSSRFQAKRIDQGKWAMTSSASHNMD